MYNFILASIGIGYDKARGGDFAHPYEFSAFYLVQASPAKLDSPYALFKPLSTDTWNTVLAVIIATEVALLLFRLTGTRAGDVDEFVLFQHFFGQQKDVFTSQFEREWRSEARHSRILKATWIIMATFLPWGYNAVYYTHMMSPAFAPAIETVDDLKKSDKSWINYKGTIMGIIAEQDAELGARAVYRYISQE